MMQDKRFKEMRIVLNLSQQKLADVLNIKQQTIANIEIGRKQKIDTEILEKLVDIYHINLEWLLLGRGKMTK